jgi:transmembrane sensor
MKERKEKYDIPEEILHLLTQKALGNLKSDDAQNLEQWMLDNPLAEDDCANYLDRIKKIRWSYLSKEITAPQVIVDRILPQRPASKTGFLQRYSYFGYAASLLILAGFVWHFLNFTIDKENIGEIVSEKSFPERQNRAVLVLSDGKNIALDEHTLTKMSDEKGVRITNLPGELLQYEKQEATVDEQLTNRLIVPAGARYQLQLSDGSKVWMNARSEIEYPVAFSSRNRLVKLTGEAYFEVAENSSVPFIIEANDYKIVVHGTSLNISAYADDSFIQTTLVTGSLEVNDRQGAAYKLNPGQMAMINHENQDVSIENVDTKIFTSWRDGILHFNKISLKELAIKLERWYDVEIHFEREHTANLLFSGAMENSRDIRFILKLISKAANVEFEIRDKQIIIN